MSVFLFVYGTLKQGFPNHHLNQGQRVAGRFRTRQRYRLHVVRLAHEDRAPWLIWDGEQGEQVCGELYEVPLAALPQIDALEEEGLPGGYERRAVLLETEDGAPWSGQAYAYLKRADELAHCLAVEGPYTQYTLELANGYYLHARTSAPEPLSA